MQSTRHLLVAALLLGTLHCGEDLTLAHSEGGDRDAERLDGSSDDVGISLGDLGAATDAQSDSADAQPDSDSLDAPSDGTSDPDGAGFPDRGLDMPGTDATFDVAPDRGSDVALDGSLDHGFDTDGADAMPDAELPTCSTCHGDGSSAAPPRDTLGRTDTALATIGAHRSHLGPSDWHGALSCEDCHIVPREVGAPGHLGPGPAELTWSELANAPGTSLPVWDGTTCAGIYCHGATLDAGGTVTAPTWTRVDGTQARCGTCHGGPPPAPHPAGFDCQTCHPTSDGPLSIGDPALHINGVVELATTSCTTCHGSEDGPAPPSDTAGESSTARTGVGAHQSHLGASDWHAEIACAECHVVPTELGDPGHTDSGLPAELTWGGRATAEGAIEPDWDGERCANTYCHGATLSPGGSNTSPTWTAVGTGEAECGSCHGIPPAAPHPTTDAACRTCHETMGEGLTIAAPERHIDGRVDVSLGCTSCHGSGGDPAPPLDTLGNSATTAPGVGAHRSHLGASSWHAEIGCDACHSVPDSIDAAGHVDSALPAELTWGALASADGAAPRYAGGTCASGYCHGSTLGAGGTNTSPEWTRVGQGEAACGTCHDVGARPRDLSGRHGLHASEGVGCRSCHANISSSGGILRPEEHIDGVLQVDLAGVSYDGRTCSGSCHGEGHRSETW